MTRSVLIVDDDPEFRALAAHLLAGSGLTVIGEADSVSAALAAAGRLKRSAVLVDAELPDGDGITLACEPAALPWRPRIVLTSIDPDIATADNTRRAHDRGCEQDRPRQCATHAVARRRIASNPTESHC